MLEHVSHLKIPETVAPFDEFRDLGNIGKIKPPRKRCLKVGFKKLAVPSSGVHEVHIDAPFRVSLSLAFIAELFSWGIGLRKEAMACGATLACQPHSRGGRPFAAHGESIAKKRRKQVVDLFMARTARMPVMGAGVEAVSRNRFSEITTVTQSTSYGQIIVNARL